MVDILVLLCSGKLYSNTCDQSCLLSGFGGTTHGRQVVEARTDPEDFIFLSMREETTEKMGLIF